MRKLLTKIILPVIALGFMASCSDWTEVESKTNTDLTVSDNPDEYYAQLRAYKKSDHAVAFGWFGNWTGTGTSLENCMAGLPDSVDFISMWGGWKNPTPEMLKDLRFVQEKKGTKALVCFIILDMGDQITPEEHNATYEDRKKFWGWVDGDDAAIKAAIEKYANALCDTIDKYNYDGFDLDWEPSYPQPFPTNKDMAVGERPKWLIEALSKRIGPKSGTGRLFVIDGEPDHSGIPSEMGSYFDYFIFQAYQSSGSGDLQSRLNGVINHYQKHLTPEEIAKKTIFCENFEKYAATGGNPNFIDQDGNRCNSVEGMARFAPVINGKRVRSGGVGTFHMEYEWNVEGKTGTYPYLRSAIRTMNPPVK